MANLKTFGEQFDVLGTFRLGQQIKESEQAMKHARGRFEMQSEAYRMGELRTQEDRIQAAKDREVARVRATPLYDAEKRQKELTYESDLLQYGKESLSQIGFNEYPQWREHMVKMGLNQELLPADIRHPLEFENWRKRAIGAADRMSEEAKAMLEIAKTEQKERIKSRYAIETQKQKTAITTEGQLKVAKQQSKMKENKKDFKEVNLIAKSLGIDLSKGELTPEEAKKIIEETTKIKSERANKSFMSLLLGGGIKINNPEQAAGGLTEEEKAEKEALEAELNK